MRATSRDGLLLYFLMTDYYDGGGLMRPTEVCMAWVVYRMTLSKGKVGGNVVCEQREWEAIERAQPGFHLLIRAGIGSEQEAEKLARGTSGDTPSRKSEPRLGTGLIAPPHSP
jgi:hypothetical protein